MGRNVLGNTSGAAGPKERECQSAGEYKGLVFWFPFPTVGTSSDGKGGLEPGSLGVRRRGEAKESPQRQEPATEGAELAESRLPGPGRRFLRGTHRAFQKVAC